MHFLKAHGRVISNVLVVILVAMALFVKVNEGGSEVLFHEKDIYIFAGAFFALLLLGLFNRRNRR